MDIEESGGRKLRIFLDFFEMTELFGSYEEIDYNDPYIRDTLHLLINRALPDCGYLAECDRLLIEVKPYNDGCLIELTRHSLANKKRRLYPPKQWRLDFFDTESMLNALCLLYNRNRPAKERSALFKSQKGYHAIVSTTKAAVSSISRYCTVQESPIAIAQIYEYALPICKEAAIERIGSAFSST